MTQSLGPGCYAREMADSPRRRVSARSLSNRDAAAVTRSLLLIGPLIVASPIGCTPAAPSASQEAKATSTPNQPPVTEATANTGGGATNEATADAVPDSVAVELHEWGLIATAIADRQILTFVGAGPHHPPPAIKPAPQGNGQGTSLSDLGGGGKSPMGTKKPVIYAHLQGEAAQTFRVSVRTPSSAIVEHWPQGELVDADGLGQVSWNVTVKPADQCVLAAWPAADDARCTGTADGYCELQELSSYATADGSCIAVEGADYDHLFYRASSSVGRSALTTVRDEKGFVVVRAREGAAAPTSFLHIRRLGRAVEVTKYPMTGDAILIPSTGSAPQGEAVADAGAWLKEALDGGGLTPDERDAFVRAWQHDLFDPITDRAASTSAKSGSVATGPAPTREAILYVMSEAELDAITKLEITPKPQALKRVFLGYVDLVSPPKKK